MKSIMATLAASMFFTGLGASGTLLSADISSLPMANRQGDVSYITGGIGEDEADAIKKAAATHSLELLFAQKAQPKDEYLADVKVTIRDRSGRPVLQTTSDGPFLLANLPAGKYQVEANYEGETKHQTVEIRSGKHQRAVFVWRRRDESMLSSAN